MKTKINEEVKYTFSCHECKEFEFNVTHLYKKNTLQSFGTWYCDNCGQGHYGTINGMTLDINLSGEIKKDIIVLLKKDNEYYLVKGMEFGNRSKDKIDESGKYFYEEHTCPTNIMRKIIEIVSDGEEDEHGIFEYIGHSEKEYDDCEGAITYIKENFGLKV